MHTYTHFALGQVSRGAVCEGNDWGLFGGKLSGEGFTWKCSENSLKGNGRKEMFRRYVREDFLADFTEWSGGCSGLGYCQGGCADYHARLHVSTCSSCELGHQSQHRQTQATKLQTSSDQLYTTLSRLSSKHPTGIT